MSIRWRLTLWFALVLLVILVISGIVLHTLLQRYLYNDVDNSLRAYSARVHGTFSPETISEPLDYAVIHDRLPPVNEFSSPGIYIQIIDSGGRVVARSDNLGNQELPVSPSLIEKAISGSGSIQTVTAGNNAEVRILASPLYMPGETLILEVARSLEPAEAALGRMRVSLIAGTLLALLLTGVLGAVLVRRTLKPVENITRTARSIEESSDLNRRVDYRGPHDEIGRLATTFDHMIEHLEKAFESQKRFIADASHELRTPLTVIQGNLDLLKRNLNEEDRQESLRAIERQSRRMTKISSDLLLLAEVESGQAVKKEIVSLKGLVFEELERARMQAGNRRVIAGRLEDIQVKGDILRLSQVLGNLVDNALRYTPDGGIITLSVYRSEDWAQLEVADTGIGIAPEHVPCIFDRFYRTDKARARAQGGTGLGLAIVKGIVEQHGGKVEVTSEPGKGSVFKVLLPLKYNG